MLGRLSINDLCSWPFPSLALSFFVVVVCLFALFCFSRQDFSVALEPALELALVDQVGLELTETHLLVCWDIRHAPPQPSFLTHF